MYILKCEGKDGFIPVCAFGPSPKIDLPTLLVECAKGLLLTHYYHKQLYDKGPML